MRKIRIPSGQTAGLWFGFNRPGRLHYLIRTRDGSDTARLWWILWGYGTTELLGERREGGTVRIPIARERAVLAAGLRAEASEDTVVYLDEEDEIDDALPFEW